MRNQDGLAPFRKLVLMRSRIPALDALTTFVAEGQEPDEVLKTAFDQAGSSRWHPVPGGSTVLIPYEGGEFDAERFKIEKGGWDHEHCKVCSARIPPMTLRWVTEKGPYIILCEACHKKLEDT